MKKYRGCLLWLFFIFTAALLLLITINGYLNSSHSLRYIETHVNAIIPGSISIQTHHLSLPGGNIELNHILLYDVSGKQIAYIDKLLASLVLMPLFHREIRISDIILDGPRADLVTDSNNSLNVVNALVYSDSKPASGETEASISDIFFPVRILIQNGRIRNTVVTYPGEGEQAELSIPDLTFGIKADMLHVSGSGWFQATSGNITRNTMSFPLPSLKGDASWIQDRIDSLTILAETEYTSVSLSGSISRIGTAPELNLSADIDCDLAEIRNTFKLQPVLSGRIHAKTEVSGNFRHPLLHAELVYDGGKMGNMEIEKMNCVMDASDKKITIEPLNLTSGLGGLTLTGNIDLSDALPDGLFSGQQDMEAVAYEFLIDQKGIQLEKMFQVDHRTKGTVNSKLKISGSGVSPEHIHMNFSGDIGIDDLKTEPMTASLPAWLKIEGTCDNGVIHFEKAVARTESVTFSGKGTYALRTKETRADVKAETRDIHPLASLFGIEKASGGITLEGTVSGIFPSLNADVFLKGDNLGYTPARIGNVDSVIHLSDGALEIAKLHVQNRRSESFISGTVQLMDTHRELSKNPEIKLSLAQSTLYMDDVTDTWKGRVIITGNMAGSILHPTGNFTLTGSDMDSGYAKPADMNVTIVLENNKMMLPSFDIRFPENESIKGSGWISTNDTYYLTIMSDGISLHQMEPVMKTDAVDGLLRFDITGEGTWDHPRFDGTIHLDAVSIYGKQVESLSVQAELDNQTMTISGRRDFDVTGALNFSDLSFSAQAGLDNTDLAPYFGLFDHPDLGGNVTGTIDASGTFNDIQNAEISAAIEQVQIFQDNLRILQAGNFEVFYKNETMDIPGARVIVADEGTMDIRGRFGMSTPGDLSIKGNFPVIMVRLFSDELQDMTGALKLDASISGTWVKPDISGDIELSGIGMDVPHISQKFHDINGIIHFQPGMVRIDGIQGMLDTGRFDISGTADMTGLKPSAMMISVNVEMLPVTVPDTMEVLTSARLKFHQTAETSGIEGDIVILDGVYYQDIKLAGYTDMARSVFQREREKGPVKKNVLPEFLAGMDIDITLKHRLPFKVDNNVALLEIQPDLVVTGKLGNPILEGQARVESGEVIYQRKTFTVEKGIITFNNPYKTEPYIDISANTRIRKWLINLHAAGTPERLKLDLTSTPPESEGDILSLLMVGRTSKELIAKDGNAAQTPTQMLSELIASTFAEDIKHVTGLDIVEVGTPDTLNGADPDRPRVTVGTKPSERLTVKHSMESRQGEMVQETSSEYQITENTMITGFQDTKGVFGGSLIYRLEFR